MEEVSTGEAVNSLPYLSLFLCLSLFLFLCLYPLSSCFYQQV